MPRWLNRGLVAFILVSAATLAMTWKSNRRLHLPYGDSWFEADLELFVGDGLFERRVSLNPEPGGWQETGHFLLLVARA